MENKRRNKVICSLMLLSILAVFTVISQSCNYVKDEKDNKQSDTITIEKKTGNSESSEDVLKPLISFKDEKGGIYTLDSLRGKVLFINFWATWCPPCKAEMPSIQTLYNKFKGNDKVEFLLVEIENDIEGANKFLKQENLVLPIVYPNSSIPEEWLSGAIPTTVILNKAGELVSREQGMRDYSAKSVEDFIQNLINQ